MTRLFNAIIYFIFGLSIVTSVSCKMAENALAASASSSISQIVEAGASITKISDFKFLPKKMSSAKYGRSNHNGPVAQFNLAGTHDNTFTVTLPEKSILLKNSSKLMSKRLEGITSFPAGSTKINKNGVQKILIGISKVPQLSKNDSNFYSGRLTVDVVY